LIRLASKRDAAPTEHSLSAVLMGWTIPWEPPVFVHHPRPFFSPVSAPVRGVTPRPVSVENSHGQEKAPTETGPASADPTGC
ncbi:hypothetical protein, partial [Acetobacter sp. DmW_125123]|uniref:hypothetical protein n=1 Tax=Acetobacter sp. DmW_125123 TaxID=2591078 RepID=UPI001EE32F50